MRYVVTGSLFRTLWSVNTNRNEVNKMRSVDEMRPFVVQYTTKMETRVWRYNWETLFWGDINTGTCPLEESQILGSKIWS
jgi:hypothetical protein